MADAPRGAVAPTPAAVRAALSIPHHQAAAELAPDAPAGAAVVALPPLQLLREFDGWLQNTGHDDRHPWRLSILATLARHGSDGPTVCAEGAVHVFTELAERMESLEGLLSALLNGKNELWPAAFTVVAQAGWMADEASKAHGGELVRGDAADWLLPPLVRSALKAATLATTEGGAA